MSIPKLSSVFGLSGPSALSEGETNDGRGPSLTEVYHHVGDRLSEAPLDWKKSFGKAKKALGKSGVPGIAKGIEVPKAPPKPPEAKPIRGKGGPENDPLKTATTGEVFETEDGTYFVYRGVNQRYYTTFVDGDHKKARDLGEHPGRKEAIDAVLADHDKNAAGVGEEVELDPEE